MSGVELRDGFRAIASGWMLRDDSADLADRIERLIEWSEGNLPLTPDERATLNYMLAACIEREFREKLYEVTDDQNRSRRN